MRGDAARAPVVAGYLHRRRRRTDSGGCVCEGRYCSGYAGRVATGRTSAAVFLALGMRASTLLPSFSSPFQVIRVLHATAALRSNPGDELLLAYLRLMDGCAAGGPEAADILRRQVRAWVAS